MPGHLVSVPSPPTKIADMPEGDSLIYVITISGKFSIFLMSTANYIERAIAGLKPDVALVASIFANQINDYPPAAPEGPQLPEGDPPHTPGTTSKSPSRSRRWTSETSSAPRPTWISQ